MKLSKQDLTLIFSLAKDYYVNESPDFLSNQEFIAQCYIKAAQNLIPFTVEFPTRYIEDEGTE
jgi:hypothetical protein